MGFQASKAAAPAAAATPITTQTHPDMAFSLLDMRRSEQEQSG
jgi:hypothetical protein